VLLVVVSCRGVVVVVVLVIGWKVLMEESQETAVFLGRAREQIWVEKSLSQTV